MIESSWGYKQCNNCGHQFAYHINEIKELIYMQPKYLELPDVKYNLSNGSHWNDFITNVVYCPKCGEMVTINELLNYRQLIRCKECKYLCTSKNGEVYGCSLLEIAPLNLEDYCSYAELREN